MDSFVTHFFHSARTARSRLSWHNREEILRGKQITIRAMRAVRVYILVQRSIQTSCSSAALPYILVQRSIQTSCSSDSNPRPPPGGAVPAQDAGGHRVIDNGALQAGIH